MEKGIKSQTDENVIKKEFKIEFLHQHYQDTFKHLRDYMQKRDRYSLIIVLIVSALYLFSIDSALFSEILNQFFNKWVGSSDKNPIIVHTTIIHSTLLIILLMYLLNYYRLINLISNQISYLSNLEKKINKIFSEDFIFREGAQYFKLPKFIRGFSKFIYKTLFPVLLIILVGYNVYFFRVFSYLDCIISLVIIIISIFYLVNTNKNIFKKKL